MDIYDFKKQYTKELLGINGYSGRIMSMIDFGNVNYWFHEDSGGNPIDLERLRDFLALFSHNIRFYYGHDPESIGSMSFLRATKHIYGGHKVYTKQIQKIRHRLDQSSLVIIPKCNFDVEITLDAVRLADKYDVMCLLSSDSDFLPLLRHLRTKMDKKVILIKNGFVQHALLKSTDKVISAIDIKRFIVSEKQQPDLDGPGLADS